MDTSSIFPPPTAAEWATIYKEVGVDAGKVENSLRLLQEWLKSEAHLPSDLDERLLRNFILGCKGNLDKSKQKLERYLIAKTKLTRLFRDRTAALHKDGPCYPVHRVVFVSTKYTKNGNRVVIYRIPTPDTTHLEFSEILKHVMLFLDVLLYCDCSAGMEVVYDVGHFTAPVLSKIDLTAVRPFFNAMYNVFPTRIRSLFVLNASPPFRVLFNIATALMSKKLRERVTGGGPPELKERLPAECLPEEYGGADVSMDVRCEEYLSLLRRNEAWCRRVEGVTLAGPVPEHKKDLYSFEDFGMDGSFRKLDID